MSEKIKLSKNPSNMQRIGNIIFNNQRTIKAEDEKAWLEIKELMNELLNFYENINRLNKTRCYKCKNKNSISCDTCMIDNFEGINTGG